MASVDFRGQLKKQIGFIQRSCKAYDAGELDEAIRMATAIRVIFHDTKGSTSLMKHLQVGHFELMSSMPPSRQSGEGTLMLAAPLLTMEASTSMKTGGKMGERVKPLGLSPKEFQTIMMASMEAKVTFRPRLHTLELRSCPFPKWWDEEVVAVAGGHTFTRRGLVLAAANKDGGAHVDASLPAGYECLLSGSPFVMKVTKSMRSANPEMADEYLVHPTDMHHATLRQLAFEVLESPSIQRLA